MTSTLGSAPSTLPQANESCWCGSGRKYKRCHKKSEGRILQGLITPMREVPANIARPPYADTGEYEAWDEGRVKSPEIIERMRASGKLAGEVLKMAGDMVKPGVTTETIDIAVHQAFIDGGTDSDSTDRLDAGSVELHAIDRAKINATTAAASVGGAFGSTGIAVTIGISNSV